MYRKILIGGVTAAAILGAGGTAMAVSSTDAPAANPKAGAKAAHGKHGKHNALGRALHGSFVTKNKKGVVTHDVIRGSVTAASPTAVTVRAADGFSQTYRVTKTTLIKQRKAGKGNKPTDGTIGDIAKGDKVQVVGTGSTTVTATRIVERLAK